MKRMSIALLCLIGILVSAAVVADDHAGRAEPASVEGIQTDALVYVENGPVEKSTLHADGREIDVPTQIVTRPMCGSDVKNITKADLARWRQSQRDAFAPGAPLTVLDTPGPRGGGPTFNFNLTAEVPAEAVTAIAAVKAYLESQWVDPISVTINVDFEAMGAGVLGATGSSYLIPTYSTVRTGLTGGMDPDDTLQLFLPVGSTIPVRYDGTSSTVTDENVVYVTRGNYNAAIGTSGGSIASMTYNTQFTWDYDPTNGITPGRYCFQSVMVHETGHAMGFTSGADFRTMDIELLDLFRFQRTDGSGDYNPDDTTEFGATPRTVDFNTPDDDANSDLIIIEYAMADGDPHQASHFREQLFNIGVMDPTFASGVTFYPNFYKAADRDMFDAMGWDNTDTPPDFSPPEPDPMTFDTPPTAATTTSITMTATSALDDTPPVQFQFLCTSGTPGGTSSFWQTSTSYLDSGLQPNTLYSYRVSGRDSETPTPNQTAFSTDFNVATAIETPQGMAQGSVGLDFADLVAQGSFSNLAVGSSGLYFDSITPGGDTGLNVWVQGTTATATGLTPNTDYEFQVKARNQDGVETAYGPSIIIHTNGVTGDCNNDAVFSVESDLDCIVNALLGTEEPPGGLEGLDMNFDGWTDGADIQIILDCFMNGGC